MMWNTLFSSVPAGRELKRKPLLKIPNEIRCKTVVIFGKEPLKIKTALIYTFPDKDKK